MMKSMASVLAASSFFDPGQTGISVSVSVFSMS